ncbi:MAG TPA: hypothetical protein VFC00_31010 [Micromonosporaceae bacterium]|nr:hypothetical protein [Micromonosporaceae bacterium]
MTPLLCAATDCDRRAADGLQLCWGHTHGIEKDAPRCAHLHDDLALVLTATGGPGASGFDGGVSINLAAADARALIRTTLTGIALHIAHKRGIRLPGSHRLQRPPAGVHGPHNRIWQPNTNKHALGAYIATHHLWLAANHPIAADRLDHATREGRHAAYPNGTRTIDIGHCPDETDGQPCTGKIRALIRDEDNLLPSAVHCDTNLEHTWNADQWRTLGRTLGIRQTRYLSALEIAIRYQRPVGTVYRLASQQQWRRTDDGRRPVLYDTLDVQRTMSNLTC